MHYITLRTSSTGKKFAAVEKKIKQIIKQQRALAKELGFDAWRKGRFTAIGGYSSLCFNTPPDMKVYKRVGKDEYMPRLSTKAGKVIKERLAKIPVVERRELNSCIGYKEPMFQCIGFARNNEKYFGFIVQEEWKVKVSKDCKEVTTTKYKQLFK